MLPVVIAVEGIDDDQRAVFAGNLASQIERSGAADVVVVRSNIMRMCWGAEQDSEEDVRMNCRLRAAALMHAMIAGIGEARKSDAGVVILDGYALTNLALGREYGHEEHTRRVQEMFCESAHITFAVYSKAESSTLHRKIRNSYFATAINYSLSSDEDEVRGAVAPVIMIQNDGHNFLRELTSSLDLVDSLIKKHYMHVLG